MTSQIYSINRGTQQLHYEIIETIVVSYHRDRRALSSIKGFLSKGTIIKNIIVISYNQTVSVDSIREEIGVTQHTDFFKVVNVSQNQDDFIRDIKEIRDYLVVEKFFLDISCMNIPQMFLFLKLLKFVRRDNKFQILYTVPFDYSFSGDPFTSYKSYLGDLETSEIIGFSGDSEKTREANLVVFIGFEGALSSKIIDDTNYNELFLVNGLPAFYQKYKDIVVINNYETISQQKNKIRYVPADNPFEVFNFLDEVNECSIGMCVAPLSTKPIALGVCLYALSHPDVRVIYPMSGDIMNEKTLDVHETIAYEISF